MAPDTRLNFLVELREDARLTQADVARRFGLSERQGYKSVAAWEQGESVPTARRRARFIGYLWDDLGLRKEPARFEACWETLVERWHWEPLSGQERVALHLPPMGQAGHDALNRRGSSTTNAEGSVVGGDVLTNGGVFVGGDQFNLYVPSQLEKLVHTYRQVNDQLDEVGFAEQLTGYLRWVIERTENIELRGVKLRDGTQTTSLRLAEVYVTLNAELVGGQGRDTPKELVLEQILTANSRLAVVGGPGCGKTTLLIYIAWVLANAIVDNNPLWAEEKLGIRLDAEQPTLPLPIYMPLSVYARQCFGNDPQRGSGEQTLVEFLPSYLNRNASSIKQLPPDFLERLLNNGHHVILLLDGLDEVADEGERRQIREAIENLVTSRRQIRVAVTCRTIAFQGRTVLARGFQQVNIRPLDEDQVALLVHKAYEYQYRDDEIERRAKTAELLAGIAKLEAEHSRRGQKDGRRLIDTPLMVRMLLVVHLSDRKLPQHRADLYKRFTDTIIHSDHAFDDSVAEALRKLDGNSPELLRALAFGMHQRGEQQGREIDADELRVLLKPTFVDKIDAFLNLTRQRGTLLEERDGLYRFLHLAFQEYLAACYLVEDFDDDGRFSAKIQFFSDGQILNSWWREVALLIPGYLINMDRSQLAKRYVLTWAGVDERYPITHWSPDVQLAAAEIAATAVLEWFDRDEDMRHRLALRLTRIFTNPELLNETRLQLRILAARALNELGDLRFRSDAWYLLNDSMLGFIEIPAGTFTMGEGEGAHRVTLPTFYIARWPVTVAQFRAFIEATAEQSVRPKIRSDADNHPVAIQISWFKATQYCAWLTETLHAWGGTPASIATKLQQGWQIMLPSEAEWERAARGSEGRIYPWGNEDIEPNRANYMATGIGTTSAVGCFPAGATPEGVEELSGNIWEWTRSLYLDYRYPSDEQGRSERERFEAENEEVFSVRGGYYGSSAQNMRAPARDPYRADGIYDVNRGFRVVLGAAPRQLAL